MNTIAMNSIRCHRLTTCEQAQMEMDRISSSPFAFFMTQDIIGIVLTYLASILAGLSQGQAMLGLLLKL